MTTESNETCPANHAALVREATAAIIASNRSTITGEFLCRGLKIPLKRAAALVDMLVANVSNVGRKRRTCAPTERTATIVALVSKLEEHLGRPEQLAALAEHAPDVGRRIIALLDKARAVFTAATEPTLPKTPAVAA